MNEHEPVEGGEPTQAGKRPRKAAKEKEAPAPADGGGIDPHESVSGGEVGPPGEAADGAETNGFEGVAAGIETVEGFDLTPATQEALLSEEVEISKEMAALPPAEDLTYEKPETVCGVDNRVRISPATTIPWRWCCELLITYPNNAGARGTGWFIGPKTVMTAGHVVYSAGNGGWARRIEVIPGMDGASRPYGSQVGTSFRSVSGWTSSGNPEYDYGAIILPNNTLGNTVGWFGFANLSDVQLQNLFVNTAGYPGDKPFGTLWFNAGAITQVTARRLLYMVDTAGGQSGSAVWRYLNGQRHAVGIHGYGGCPNKAVRIVAPVYNNMLAWKAL
jgi:glutamyl endopeptidase